MGATVSLLGVLGLVLLTAVGISGFELHVIFGVVLPYLAVVLFLVGFGGKIVRWARTPVPFRIPTTAGQQKSMGWIRNQPLQNPHNRSTVVARILLEVLFFRSLFRNTRAEMVSGGRLVYLSSRGLWLLAMAFHWAFLVILVRHLRFLVAPVPGSILGLASLDGFFEISVPALYLTDILIIAALGGLLLRRLVSPQVRYISLASDYFPLFLLLGVVISGIVLRHFAKTDVVAIKALGLGLLSLHPPGAAALQGIGVQFYIHLFLVCTLVAVFPFSKLMHMGGVFMSPTLNMANTSRLKRHVNPWNPPLEGRGFEDWEEDFTEEIKEAGLKLERD